jgi:hypothetical protein
MNVYEPKTDLREIINGDTARWQKGGFDKYVEKKEAKETDAEIARFFGVSITTAYRWNKSYQAMKAAGAR